jgi:hypothetical protein
MTASKYAPLRAFLQGQPPETPHARLSFAELERILCQPLPAAARTLRPWWANTLSHAQAAAWLAVGWKAKALNLEREEVVFERVELDEDYGVCKRELNRHRLGTTSVEGAR